MTITITTIEAADRIALFAAEGRLRREKWHGQEAGREVACLLGAIHSDIESTQQCPAHLMPGWMAELTVGLFDRLADADVASVGQHYAAAMRVWSGLGPDDWQAVKTNHLIRCVELALAKAEPQAKGLDVWPQVTTASQQVVAALRAGDSSLLEAAWSAAEAARSAAWSAAWSAAEAARSAAEAARSAALSAAWSAAEAARSAARSAAWSAAEAAEAASSAARSAAWSAARSAAEAVWSAAEAASRELFDALLDDIIATAAARKIA